MDTKFNFYEVVHVVAQPPRIRKAVAHKEGIVVGMSDPDDQNRRDYGVHINEYGETFAIPEDALESTGRISSPKNIVSRSRAKGRRP